MHLSTFLACNRIAFFGLANRKPHVMSVVGALFVVNGMTSDQKEITLIILHQLYPSGRGQGGVLETVDRA